MHRGRDCALVKCKSSPSILGYKLTTVQRITRPALLGDYPWKELDDARVIDVGCGPGDCAFDIMGIFPRLKWTFQDLPDVIERLKKVSMKSRVERALKKANSVLVDSRVIGP